jgi:undecaprenyl pyrophosphate phosphatase UppP
MRKIILYTFEKWIWLIISKQLAAIRCVVWMSKSEYKSLYTNCSNTSRQSSKTKTLRNPKIIFHYLIYMLTILLLTLKRKRISWKSLPKISAIIVYKLYLCSLHTFRKNVERHLNDQKLKWNLQDYTHYDLSPKQS